MFRSRFGVLLGVLLAAALWIPCQSATTKKGKKKESTLRQTVTKVSIQADSALDVSFGSALKQKTKRPRGKDADFTKMDLEFNGSFSWGRDNFAFSVKDAGSVTLSFDAEKGVNSAYRNIFINGEKKHDGEALGPISIDVTAEAGKSYRVTFESRKVSPADAAKMEREDDSKAAKKAKKKKKKKSEDDGE